MKVDYYCETIWERKETRDKHRIDISIVQFLITTTDGMSKIPDELIMNCLRFFKWI
jgi:hypothetical protein